MENFSLISLIEELKQVTGGLVISRIIQHQPNGFILQTRFTKIPTLKIWLDPRTPAIYTSDSRPPIDQPTTDFTMVLRKHLNDARLIKIEKPLSERIVEMVFRTTLPARELETLILVVELIPNAPNMILLDKSRHVLATFAPLSAQHQIADYEGYQYPTVARKLSLETVCENDAWFDQEEFSKKGKPWLIEHVSGIGPILAAEAVHRSTNKKEDLPGHLQRLIVALQQPSERAWVYTLNPLSVLLTENKLNLLSQACFSPIELFCLEKSHSSKSFTNMLDATTAVYDELESRTLLEKIKAPKRRALKDRLRKLHIRTNRMLHQLEQFEQNSEIQKNAQLLVSSGASMDDHHDKVKVVDYLDTETATREIQINSSITLRENVSKMFKKYKKANRGKLALKKQLEEVDNLKHSLEKKANQLQSIKDWTSWFALTGKPPKSKGRVTATPKKVWKRPTVVRINDREIIFGRNDKENEELTFKVASDNDFWLHVANYSGSHVIVRNPTKDAELEDTVLVQAAQLAAYHSKARNSSKVEVHYTQRKFVSKPRKAKDGLVTIRKFKSIMVEPKNCQPNKQSISTNGKKEVKSERSIERD